MTRITKTLSAILVATPAVAFAQAEPMSEMNLEEFQDMYGLDTVVEFEALDTNGDGLLSPLEQERIEGVGVDNENDIDLEDDDV